MKTEEERKVRGNTWRGLYPRKTKTKKEKIESIEKKHKKDYREED